MADPPPQLSWMALILVTLCAGRAGTMFYSTLQPVMSRLAAVVGDGSLDDTSPATYSHAAVAYFESLHPDFRMSAMMWLNTLNVAWSFFAVGVRTESFAHWKLGFALFMCSFHASSIKDARMWSSGLYASHGARMRARRGMIGGIIVPPLAALWAAGTGPQAIGRYGRFGWLFVVLYACQSVIWLLLFCMSLQESVVALAPVILVVRPAFQ